MDEETSITGLLASIRAGEPGAETALMQAVYDQLKRIAHQRVKHERAGQTWRTTDLVHEWYLCVHSQGGLHHIEDRKHLANAASLAMRNLLIDHRRKSRRASRGGDRHRYTLDQLHDSLAARSVDVVVLSDALDALKAKYPRQGTLFEQHFFGGFTTSELAELYGISLRTAQDDLHFAKAHLWKLLGDADDGC